MRVMRRSVTAVVLLVAMLATACGDPADDAPDDAPEGGTGQLRVIVLDDNGDTVANATVVPEAVNVAEGYSFPEKVHRTDDRGTITWKNLPPGEYRVSVGSDEDAPAQEAEVTADDTVDMEIVVDS